MIINTKGIQIAKKGSLRAVLYATGSESTDILYIRNNGRTVSMNYVDTKEEALTVFKEYMEDNHE